MKHQPLHQLRVLNTRPEKQGNVLSHIIQKAGGFSINCPALAIHPTEIHWVYSVPALNTVDQAIFTSINAVEYSLPILKKFSIDWPPTIQNLAIGKSTAGALKKYGLQIHAIAPDSTSESLLQLNPLQTIVHHSILLLTGENGRPLIAETIADRGALLHTAYVYKRIAPTIPKSPELMWNEIDFDIILFTSREAMLNIITLFKVPHWFFQKPCLVISQRLEKAASSLGFKTIIVCKPDTILNALCQFNQGVIYDKTQKSTI